MTESTGREARPEVAVWGGFECTQNRVGDAYNDQLAWCGHPDRLDDLDRVAALGIRTVRYPALWEHAAAGGRGAALDWSRAGPPFARLKALGVRPIAGLVHHGSGPPHTDLLDDGFAEGLAAYALEVARRFPWVDSYTPVNEPLTTARFSGLYGHWYPHHRNDRSFARAVVVQCRAVALAMRAVRTVRSDARLVQTEDLGKTHGSPALADQVAFENERRWLTFDLLAGRVDRHHPLTRFLRDTGVSDRELGWFRDNPCPPDVVGVNYYATSERYIDDRVGPYPPLVVGGNGRTAYADVEAVRVLPGGCAGLRTLLGEAWDRFGLPVAVTEAHLGCTREEQLRWLHESWTAVVAARRAGADVRALTVWSLLGAYDWDSLMTRRQGRYEPGVFDLRAPTPRPTALAGLVRDLASGRTPDHPVLDSPGWWRRPSRLSYRPRPASPPLVTGRPVLVLGGDTPLGRAFTATAAARGLACRSVPAAGLAAEDAAAVGRLLDSVEPWAVVQASSAVRVDADDAGPRHKHRATVRAAAVLASAASARGTRLLLPSTDLVFDGRPGGPYREDDAPAPLSAFGRCKALAERKAQALHPGGTLVARLGPCFDPHGRDDFAARVLLALAEGQEIPMVEDVIVTATYLPDAVDAILDLLIDGEAGVWHLACPGGLTWAELGRTLAESAGYDPSAVRAVSSSHAAWRAPRPGRSDLTSIRGQLLDAFGPCLERYLDRRGPRLDSPTGAVDVAPHARPVDLLAAS